MVILVAIIAGIITLFVRGFRVSDLTKPSDAVTTPAVSVWLVKIPEYATKMDAYKAAYAHSNTGTGIYAQSENQQWTWVAGVYSTSEQAENLCQNASLPANVVNTAYQITGKRFTVEKAIAIPVKQLLALLVTIQEQLVATREMVTAGENVNDAVLTLTDSYQQLRTTVETLQTVNIQENSPLVASMIYAGNQNILALFEVVFADVTKTNQLLSALNTALIKNIFSLDNW